MASFCTSTLRPRLQPPAPGMHAHYRSSAALTRAKDGQLLHHGGVLVALVPLDEHRQAVDLLGGAGRGQRAPAAVSGGAAWWHAGSGGSLQRLQSTSTAQRRQQQCQLQCSPPW